MKHVVRIGVFAAVLALLAGCYISLDEGADSVGIRLPAPRSVAGAAPQDTGRIFVLNGAKLVNVGDGAPYAEFALEPAPGQRLQEYSVGPVPAGPGYRVVLVFGSYVDVPGRGSFFVPSGYALSDEFAVVAGQANQTNELELVDAGFLPVDFGTTLGRSLVGIVWDGSNLYTATDTALYSAAAGPDNFETISFAFSVTVPGGRTVNSLSLGATTTGPTVWVNTNRGILVGTGFSEAMMAGSGIEEKSILDSGALHRAGSFYGYLQFAGGLSGLQNVLETINWLEPIDLSEIVVGQPVYDMDVERGTTARGYFASKLGAFRLEEDILDTDITNTQELFASDFTDFFEVAIGGRVATITSLAVANDSPYLYVGTGRGAMRIETADIGVNPDTDRVEGLLIPASTGQIVKDIVAQGNLVVIVTSHSLLYSTNGAAATPTFTEIPLYASSVGEVTGILLDPVNGIALLSGTGGLVGIEL